MSIVSLSRWVDTLMQNMECLLGNTNTEWEKERKNHEVLDYTERYQISSSFEESAFSSFVVPEPRRNDTTGAMSTLGPQILASKYYYSLGGTGIRGKRADSRAEIKEERNESGTYRKCLCQKIRKCSKTDGGRGQTEE